MKHSAIPTLRRALEITLSLLLLTGLTGAQSINQKLSQQVLFTPYSARPFDQLIEIAKRFQVPMGIEWDAGSPDNIDESTFMNPHSILGLIELTARRSSGYKVAIQDGVVNILPTSLIDNPRDFLNLRIPDFAMQQQDLFSAQWTLHLRIKSLLKPNQNKGFVGGYIITRGRGDGFDNPNITFQLKDATVREILNRMALANGNALWIVYRNSSGEEGQKQLSLELENLKDDRHSENPWQFVPFGVLGKK